MEMISCLAADLKLILSNELDRKGVVEDMVSRLLSIPDCQNGEIIGFGSGTADKSKGQNKDGTPRKKSAYNEFISQCMKGREIARNKLKASDVMKDCAKDWNAQKGK